VPNIRASAGDRLLVCSDGLVNEVSDEEIASFVEAGDAQAVVDGLIELAQTRGGRDDISVIVADISA
jgi:PPM family protein phosphatase